ncbi:MAG: hypothetical protein ACI94Y_000508 [Maribacter sp.]|jgi:hypothetical protein
MKSIHFVEQKYYSELYILMRNEEKDTFYETLSGFVLFLLLDL